MFLKIMLTVALVTAVACIGFMLYDMVTGKFRFVLYVIITFSIVLLCLILAALSGVWS